MICNELKKLRKEKDLTLKAISSKVGYGTGNLSSYENGKINPRDKTLLRILTRGFEMSTEKAKDRIILWRKKELEETYNIRLAQVDEPYNTSAKHQRLDEYLEAEGLDKDSIQKIKREIQTFKKNVKK